MTTPLNHPIRADEDWIALELHKRDIPATVTHRWNRDEDGIILIGQCADGKLKIQVGDSYVTASSEQGTEERPLFLLYDVYFKTVEELAEFIKSKEVRS